MFKLVKPFGCVKKETLTQGTRRDLTRWIAQYANLLYPDAHIQQWSDLSSSPDETSPAIASILKVIGQDFHVSVYITRLLAEDPVLHVALVGSSRVVPLCRAIVRESQTGAWQIAGTVAAALEAVFYRGQQPAITDLSESLIGPHWPRSIARPSLQTGGALIFTIANGDHGESSTPVLQDINGVTVWELPKFECASVISAVDLVQDLKTLAAYLQFELHVAPGLYQAWASRFGDKGPGTHLISPIAA